jgi:hypothetical protein
MFDLQQRTTMLEEVVKKYSGTKFELGSDDCVHMINYGLQQLGRPVNLIKLGSYSTPAGARRAMRKAGYASLREAVTGQGFFELDAPAMAWPGDIIAMPSVEGEDVALAFMASNGRAFGFWQDTAQFFQPLAFETAWRIE